MDSLIIYFLPTILALGIVTSYEDVKEGKIRNKYVVAALGLSVLIHVLLLFFNIIGFDYVLVIGLYVLASLVLGFIAWYTRIWSAGDAKLYCAYMSLIPPTIYVYFITDFHIFALLVNSLLPYFAYLLLNLILKTGFKHKVAVLKKIMTWKSLLNILLLIFSISWLTTYLFSRLGIQSTFLYNILAIAVIAALLKRILGEQMIAFLALVAILRVFLNTGHVLTVSFLTSFVVITLGYMIILLFINNLSDYYTKKVHVYQLNPGMLLAEDITKKGFKQSSIKKGLGGVFGERSIFLRSSRGLSEEDVLNIRRKYRSGKLHFNTIKIHQATPFAQFMFLGVLITIVCNGNALLFLKAFL
jgi:hypothetical protein